MKNPKLFLIIIDIVAVVALIPFIFILGWDIMEPWTYIVTAILAIFNTSLIYRYEQKSKGNKNQKNKPNQNTNYMNYEEAKTLIDTETLSVVFDKLDAFESQMGSSKGTYNQIKREFDTDATHESKLRERLKVLVKKFLKSTEKDNSNSGGGTTIIKNQFNNSNFNDTTFN